MSLHNGATPGKPAADEFWSRWELIPLLPEVVCGQRIGPRERCCLMLMQGRSGNRPECWLYMDKLGRSLGVGPTQARETVRKLRLAKLVKARRCGYGLANEFSIDWNAVAAATEGVDRSEVIG